MSIRETVLKDMNRCTACGLCEKICPVHAIEMKYDAYGFLCPVIDRNVCIDCGLCERKCAVENISVQFPRACYAGINLDANRKEKSSSGGMFAALATQTLEENGVVFGAAIVPKNRVVTVEHIQVTHVDELSKLQGSKYVQSNATNVYPMVKEALKAGKKVLFSGTPCQVSAVRSYIGKDDDNLLLVDLVCHGTPSALYWEESLKEKLRVDEKITDVSFRDGEQYMQGHLSRATQEGIKTEAYNFMNDSYYSMFLAQDSYRESCYQCPFACRERTGDISIGDFWGFEKSYDVSKIEAQEGIDVSHGNSLVIVNTERGLQACEALKNKKMWFYTAEFENGVKYNHQLSAPSKKGKNRKIVLKLYRVGGWKLLSRYMQLKRSMKKIMGR